MILLMTVKGCVSIFTLQEKALFENPQEGTRSSPFNLFLWTSINITLFRNAIKMESCSAITFKH